MAYHYNTRARARSDVEPDDISQGDLDFEMTTAMVSDKTIVGRQVESTEGLELMSTDVAGPVTTHFHLLPEGDHSSVGGHGSLGSVSSSLMGVTLGYPSGHTDPRDSMIASTDEGQSIAGSAAIATSVATAGSSHPTTARQPPTDTETAAATSPTLYPATGSGSGPASRPSPRSGTLISRALPAQTSHEHMVSNHTKFMCLRESLDSAAIQVIPSLPSYTTHSYYFVMCSCPDNKSHVPIWLTPLLQYSCHRYKLG